MLRKKQYNSKANVSYLIYQQANLMKYTITTIKYVNFLISDILDPLILNKLITMEPGLTMEEKKMKNRLKRDFSHISIEIPKSITQVIKEKIREMIIHGDFDLGQAISENELSNILMVSKTPIREAFIWLSYNENLVNIIPRSGTFVFSVTDEDINDLIKMRVILEQGAIREAMEKNANNVIVELSNILSKSAKINAERDTQAYLKLDHDFHYVFVKYADNKYISQAHLLISARLLAIRYRLDFTAEYITSSNRGHATILDMLKNNNVEGVCNFITHHIGSSFTERARKLLALKA
ncbi:FCD domain-containing protein [Salmonella enterica subsp. enterica]|nr:FCD domain-containing protein [Salmonella enterica subsp. enterica]